MGKNKVLTENMQDARIYNGERGPHCLTPSVAVCGKQAAARRWRNARGLFKGLVIGNAQGRTKGEQAKTFMHYKLTSPWYV